MLRGARHDLKRVNGFGALRNEVPMQSDPVSPPPITTTCLPRQNIAACPSGSLQRGDFAAQEIHRVVKRRRDRGRGSAVAAGLGAPVSASASY